MKLELAGLHCNKITKPSRKFFLNLVLLLNFDYLCITNYLQITKLQISISSDIDKKKIYITHVGWVLNFFFFF